MTDILSDLEAKARAATPGERVVYNENEGMAPEYGPLWCVRSHGAEEDDGMPLDLTIHFGTKSDADFIASLSPSIALKLLKIARAAQEVVERWDTPLWKDVEPTGATIGRLRRTLTALSDGG